MPDGEQNGYKLEPDAFKFSAWCARRLFHASTGRRFGTLDLDEQMGTAIHAVIVTTKPTVGPGLRIGSAAAGAAWRAIRDIARNLDVTDLEIARSPDPPGHQPHSEHTEQVVSEDDPETD